jgi:hypothetical protein
MIQRLHNRRIIGRLMNDDTISWTFTKLEKDAYGNHVRVENIRLSRAALFCMIKISNEIRCNRDTTQESKPK